MADAGQGARDPLLAAAAEAQAVADIAGLLRRLRRRDARRRQDSELTYRELAAKTGWSQAAVGEYFRGRTLPTTDRFDVLTGLLGASPAERGALATARDRVDERHRRAARPASPGRVVPRQLPADVAGFTGRLRQLADLDARLAGRPGGALPVYAISGTAGVGKTALAVHWARRVADRFGDGQLYVNLRGFDPGGQPAPPAAAVRGFLDALGVPADRVPSTVDAQVGLYRSLLAGRRVLVLLDNARDAEQVRPLLPGTPTALVLVTSRSLLAGLVAADGAQPVAVGLLTGPEAHELLARRLGADRIAAEPAAVAGIVARCAGLPLALTVAAARAATQPSFPLAALAADLAQAGDRLAALATGDPATDVRAVFDCSYAALSPGAARLFPLLSLPAGPDISTAAAASLAGVPPAAVRALLAELTGSSLLTQPLPGRYGCHDLLRAYAGSVEADRRAAVGRLLDHYLHSGHTADRQLNPHRDPITPDPPLPGVTPEQPADRRAALDWFRAEHPAVLGAVRLAVRSGMDVHARQLGWVLQTYCYREGRWADLVATGLAAVQASASLGDPAGQAAAYRNLAAAYTQLGQYGEAQQQLTRALELCVRAGDLVGQAHAHYSLAYLCERGQRLRPGLAHARQALALYRAADHGRGQADALNACGWNHALLGEHQQALDHCTRALALQRQLGDREGQAHSWDSLGVVHHQLGDHDRAADCYQQALALFQELGDRNNEADILIHLGDTRQAAGDPAGARACWQQALGIRTDLDHPDAEAVRARLGR